MLGYYAEAFSICDYNGGDVRLFGDCGGYCAGRPEFVGVDQVDFLLEHVRLEGGCIGDDSPSICIMGYWQYFCQINGIT